MDDPDHLPVFIFNCTDENPDALILASPPTEAILWVLCWGQVIPTLPEGFLYQRTVVVSSHNDTPVVLLWAASTTHPAETLTVCFFCIH